MMNPEEVDVLAMARGNERQQLVGDIAALGAELADRLAVVLGRIQPFAIPPRRLGEREVRGQRGLAHPAQAMQRGL
ncbi:hypothetical protein E1292_47710, partial [Nonomuraea deserti]